VKKLLFTVALVVVAIFGVPGRAAAADFNVSVINFAYSINGQGSFPTITLTRGKSYTFVNADGSGFVHPFGIQTFPTNQGGALYSTGISGDAPLFDGTMTFNVPASAPSTLYYNCQNHEFMFGQIDIISAPPAAASVPAVPEGARGIFAVALAFLGIALVGRALKRRRLLEPPPVS
jgi:hypothetical protein